MQKIAVICLCLVITVIVQAQIPRTTSGQFEYSGKLEAGNTAYLKERAGLFFNQPFLIHWDTVQRKEQAGNIIVKGLGSINVLAKRHRVGTPVRIPVTIRMCIEVHNGSYTYTINHFMVKAKKGRPPFKLEEKPAFVRAVTYDQLLQNTHKRMSFVIAWMKRYMREE
jgi:hypothetical protein